MRQLLRPLPAAAVSCPRVLLIPWGRSLHGHLPNMAGLTRTTEALFGRAAELTLRTDKVLADPNFSKMSVSAEKNCTIVPVPEGPRLVTYLREKRAEGFTVLALEQTSTSTLLTRDTQLPKKVAFVIGEYMKASPLILRTESGISIEVIEVFLKAESPT